MALKKHRAYLSGGMEYARREGSDWRREMELWIRTRLGHSVFNPNVESHKFLARKYPRRNFRLLKKTNLRHFRELVSQIVDLDSKEILNRTTYVVCYWDRSAQKGAGTKGELTIARLTRKPVYLVTRFRQDTLPAWVLGCTTELFPSFRSLKLFLEEHFSRRSPKEKR